MASPAAAASSLVVLFSGRALPEGLRHGPPAFARPIHRHQQQPKRSVAAAVRRRYKGTAKKEAALAELIEKKVAEAMEECGGEAAGREEGCRVAWDEVEEVSQAKADLRRRIAESPADPLEPFCSHNPLADDCAVVYDD